MADNKQFDEADNKEAEILKNEVESKSNHEMSKY